MKSQISFFLLFSLLCLNVMGCTTAKQNFQALKDRPNAYLKSQCATPLRVPPGVEHAPLMEDQQIPPGETAVVTAPLLPPESLAQKVAEGKVSPKALKHLSRSNLQERDHQWMLTITDEKERVWKRLEKAFKNRHIDVLQKNEKTGIYYIVDTYPTKGKVTTASPIYQVHLRSTAEQDTELYLTDNAGGVPNKYVAQRLLMEIQRGLNGNKVRNLAVPKILQPFLKGG